MPSISPVWAEGKNRGLSGSHWVSYKSKAKIYCVEKLIITNLLSIHQQLQLSDFDVGFTVDS